MAIYFAGYLSPIRNKLGNAVGRKWRTLDVLAVYNGRPRNPRTAAQQAQRVKFGFIAIIARAFATAVEKGFKPLCDGTPVPQRSMFIKKNIGFVMADDPTAPTIDNSKLICAEGGLPNAAFGNVDVSNPLSVEVPLTNTTDVPGASSTDRVHIFVYNPDQKAGILSEGKQRVDESVAVNVPTQWNGERVHVYGFVVNADNSQVSNSVYIGTGSIS